MNTRIDCSREVRLVIRGKDRQVRSAKISQRQGDGKFGPCDGDWTDEHVVLLRAFAKVASAIAKGVVPPFDIGEILRHVNGPRRKKGILRNVNQPRRKKSINVQEKTVAPDSIDDGDGDWE
jgi:hypothetical protein